MLYHFHEGILDLPDGWEDQTMQVFRLPGSNGAKDAAIVITRDYAAGEEAPASYADRQRDEARRNFPGYRQISSTETEIGGVPATVVDYQWTSNGQQLRQRQAYLAHNGVILTVTLSAMVADFKRVEATWDEVIGGLQLLERETEVAATLAEPPADYPHVFVLSARDTRLLVFPDVQHATLHVDPIEVSEDAWVFFASDGTPLKPNFVQPNRRGMFRLERGRYELELDHVGVARNLRERLRAVTVVEGMAPFETLEAIVQHLQPESSSEPRDAT